VPHDVNYNLRHMSGGPASGLIRGDGVQRVAQRVSEQGRPEHRQAVMANPGVVALRYFASMRPMRFTASASRAESASHQARNSSASW
jgi:hypothetical protein